MCAYTLQGADCRTPNRGKKKQESITVRWAIEFAQRPASNRALPRLAAQRPITVTLFT